MTNLYIKNARIIDPVRRTDQVSDVIIRNGVIQEPYESTDGLRSYDATGLILAPGFWDTHVHFRDPGNPLAETRQTGARAAAAGGFTHVVTMPNTTPAGDSLEWLQEQCADDLPVIIHPSACITAGRLGRTVASIEMLAEHGAVGFTDDGSFVVDNEVMREGMIRARKIGKPLFDHAVVPSIAKEGVIRNCDVAMALNLPLFPAEAETVAIARDIRLCAETGCTLVIQHISTAGGVELIRKARAEGLPVYAEASPHHLALAAEDIPGDDGNWRMNPPLGTCEDRAAIRKAVMDGTITLFATDHAPHSFETKSKGFMKAPFGVIGLENAIGVTWKVMVEEEGMPLMDWVSCWTTHPAMVLKQNLPALVPGEIADLVLIDPSTPWIVNPEKFLSKSRNCPFAGQVLHARAVLTICNGRTTWTI
jgi:dihydroorotase